MAVASQYNVQKQHQIKAFIPPPSHLQLPPAPVLWCPLWGGQPRVHVSTLSPCERAALAIPQILPCPRSERAAAHRAAGTVPCCREVAYPGLVLPPATLLCEITTEALCREPQCLWKPDVAITGSLPSSAPLWLHRGTAA